MRATHVPAVAVTALLGVGALGCSGDATAGGTTDAPAVESPTAGTTAETPAASPTATMTAGQPPPASPSATGTPGERPTASPSATGTAVQTPTAAPPVTGTPDGDGGLAAREVVFASAERHTTLAVQPTSLRVAAAADIADLAVADRGMRPVLVSVRFTNTGDTVLHFPSVANHLGLTGDDGHAAMPVLVDERDGCPHDDVPARFATGASFDQCVVFLLRPGAAPHELSYRGAAADDPVTWSLG